MKATFYRFISPEAVFYVELMSINVLIEVSRKGVNIYSFEVRS